MAWKRDPGRGELRNVTCQSCGRLGGNRGLNLCPWRHSFPTEPRHSRIFCGQVAGGRWQVVQQIPHTAPHLTTPQHTSPHLLARHPARLPDSLTPSFFLPPSSFLLPVLHSSILVASTSQTSVFCPKHKHTHTHNRLVCPPLKASLQQRYVTDYHCYCSATPRALAAAAICNLQSPPSDIVEARSCCPAFAIVS